MRLNALGKVRRALQAVDIWITRRNYRVPHFTPPEASDALAKWKSFLRTLDTDPAGAEYLESHIDRLARTLEIVPAPGSTGRALELGCYMQVTPALALQLGYSEVRGAYYGEPGTSESKTATVGGKPVFRCQVDLFDAERNTFPYPDSHFDCVLACELIEHLSSDPMHLLLEVRRVLAANGTLVLTTPNCASLGSVTRILHGCRNPQIFSCYPHPRKPDGDNPHVREYTPFELRQLLAAAGFRVELLFTDRIGGYEEGTWTYELLKKNGFETELRGEQIYCRAVRDDTLTIDRFPDFLYA